MPHASPDRRTVAGLPPAVWLVIVAGCTVGLMNFGVRSGFGLFLDPMSAAHGWGREVFSIAIAVQNLMWGLGQPFAGAIADPLRHRPRTRGRRLPVRRRHGADGGQFHTACHHRDRRFPDRPWSVGIILCHRPVRHGAQRAGKPGARGSWASAPPPVLSASSSWCRWDRGSSPPMDGKRL